jgi:hypothetical protein
MDNDKDAGYYQGHKDDEDEWEDVPEPGRRSESRRLRAMVSVRFSPEEADSVRAAADAAGLSLSAFIRVAALSLSGTRQSVAAAWESTTTGLSQSVSQMTTSAVSPTITFPSGKAETRTGAAA